MNSKAANTAKSSKAPVSQKDKDAAKQCLILADKFLKESSFDQARTEVAKAQKLDPTNPYAYAFLDRISYFEEQKKKSPPPQPEIKVEQTKPAPPPPTPKPEPPAAGIVSKPPDVKAPAPPSVQKPTPQVVEKQNPEPPPPVRPVAPAPEMKKPAPPPPPKPVESGPRPPQAQTTVQGEEEKRLPHQPAAPVPPAKPPVSEQKPESPPPPTKPPTDEMVKASRSVIADLLATRTKSASSPPSAPGIGDVLQELSHGTHSHTQHSPKGDIDSKLDEMKRQIEMLTNALEQERKVREEMNQQKLQGAVKTLRASLEKAWANGAPKEQEAGQLRDLAVSLGVPDDVINSLNREVKLDMYSRAVKEVVSKQNLVRNSSRTLEWLRKVYQISLDEYLEYESKFLMDLVADQYKGTILLVSGDERASQDVGSKLKSMGYAVVGASSPENALEKIEKINPHFILCDMEFSKGYLSGIKFLHVLRANTKFNYIPFILLCEKHEVTQFHASEFRPTEGFIAKPFEMEQLSAVMNEKLNAFRQYLSSLS